MSLKYKYDEQNKEGQGNKTNPEEQVDIVRYETPAKVRNIHFIDLKGHQYVFNYMDLRMIDYSPETKKLSLTFISHEVIIEGQNMDQLVGELAQYGIKQICALDKRYNATKEKEVIVVNSLTIFKST